MQESKTRFVVGSLVVSHRGRDIGHPYLVIQVDRGPIVLLVDGERNKLDNPKRKNIRHLRLTKSIAADIAEKSRLEISLTNAEVRAAIKREVEGLNAGAKGAACGGLYG